jgi:hypothetical protein
MPEILEDADLPLSARIKRVLCCISRVIGLGN